MVSVTEIGGGKDCKGDDITVNRWLLTCTEGKVEVGLKAD
jgi:hypothetical protein